MKLSHLTAPILFPLALFACATAVTPGPAGVGSQTSSGAGGAGGTGGAGSGGTGGGATTTTTGTGTPGPCVKKEDCAALDDPCNTGNCVNGTCTKSPANDGSGCDDGMFCTDNDACMAGVCVGGTPKFCPSPDSCHLGLCDEAIKGCLDTWKKLPGRA